MDDFIEKKKITKNIKEILKQGGISLERGGKVKFVVRINKQNKWCLICIEKMKLLGKTSSFVMVEFTCVKSTTRFFLQAAIFI